MIHINADTLRDKIMQIETAIIHCPENYFFQQQSVMAHTIEVDENRELWLAVDKPINCAENTQGSFDIVLNYQKKDVPFDLDILGEAKMLNEDEIKVLSPGKRAMLEKGKLILHVHIIDIDYWEQKPAMFSSITQKLRYMFSHSHHNNKQEIYSDHQMSA